MDYIFETERLRFREMVPSDAEKMFELNSDPEVVQYTGDDPFESVEAARIFLEEYPAKSYLKFNCGRWILELKETGEVIGWCGLKFLSEDNAHDVGYRLFKCHWGKGYATEAALKTNEYGFEVMKLKRIIARARKENVGSVKVLQKIGMKIIGEGMDCGGAIFIFECHSTH